MKPELCKGTLKNEPRVNCTSTEEAVTFFLIPNMGCWIQNGLQAAVPCLDISIGTHLHVFRNRIWSHSSSSVNELQRYFLELIDYDTDVSKSYYAKYYFYLRHVAFRYGLSLPSYLLNRERAWDLQAQVHSNLILALKGDDLSKLPEVGVKTSAKVAVAELAKGVCMCGFSSVVIVKRMEPFLKLYLFSI
ncbi:hypothetical protein P7K49_023580 [Saguinus oedipus]|uniref:Uncharacterized protein n=1 Tax=Saguinus oedipus TaxID=9490 RepID=A0ABQ9UM62_SAGOE|nr:hypothetical protein P7K49_023580 [Saguinus oedipus]